MRGRGQGVPQREVGKEGSQSGEEVGEGDVSHPTLLKRSAHRVKEGRPLPASHLGFWEQTAWQATPHRFGLVSPIQVNCATAMSRRATAGLYHLPVRP